MRPPQLTEGKQACVQLRRKACDLLDPTTLYNSIPVVHPKVHVVASVQCGSIGRFPVEALKDEPVLDTKGWWKLAIAIAEKDMKMLSNVFDIAKFELSRM